MGKLGPKLQLSFLNSIQICRPKDISSLVRNPLPPLTHFSTQTHDILFPSFQDPLPHPSHTTPLPSKPHANTSHHPHHHFSSTKQDQKQQLCMAKEPKLKAKLGNSEEEESKKPERRRGARTQRFKRFGSKEWKDGSTSEVEARKVNESFVVMKRSVDPCQDFKKSMVEMIVEKQIYEPKELEHLLMSFLSLNSTIHHKAILKAFTQIWKEIFSGSSN